MFHNCFRIKSNRISCFMSKGLSKIDNTIKFIVLKSRQTNKCQEIRLICILCTVCGRISYTYGFKNLFVVPFCKSHHHHRNHHIHQLQWWWLCCCESGIKFVCDWAGRVKITSFTAIRFIAHTKREREWARAIKKRTSHSCTVNQTARYNWIDLYPREPKQHHYI